MVRSMISYSDLPKFLCGYTLETTVYSLNSIPIESVMNTHIELWTGRKASIQHYKIWGCPAYVHKGKTGKLDTK